MKSTALKGLLNWLAESASRSRAARWLGAAFRFDVATDLAAEVQAEQVKLSQQAYTAEQADREAASAIETALSDGQLDASDLPAIKTALRNVQRSAEHDRQITESLVA